MNVIASEFLNEMQEVIQTVGLVDVNQTLDSRFEDDVGKMRPWEQQLWTMANLCYNVCKEEERKMQDACSFIDAQDILNNYIGYKSKFLCARYNLIINIRKHHTKLRYPNEYDWGLRSGFILVLRNTRNCNYWPSIVDQLPHIQQCVLFPHIIRH